MSADPVRVQRLLSALEQAVRNLRRHAGRPREALDDLDEAWAVLHGLQICAQSVLDLSVHLCAAMGRDATDYTDAIHGLASVGVLPSEFARSFRGVAGFRNVVVHGYLAVDLDRVHRFLNQHLGDFVTFASHVDRWMAGSGGAGSGPGRAS